jgi:hypothetical protein
MQSQLNFEQNNAATETLQSRTTGLGSCSPRTPTVGRRVSISSPGRGQQNCVTWRAMLAALREAELAEWQASGGDVLDRAYQQRSLSN